MGSLSARVPSIVVCYMKINCKYCNVILFPDFIKQKRVVVVVVVGIGLKGVTGVFCKESEPPCKYLFSAEHMSTHQQPYSVTH